LGHNLNVEFDEHGSEISLRPVADGDSDFLFDLYAETRQHEVEMFGWDAAAADGFLRMQFDVRSRSYALQYPQAVDSVISCSGQPAGRMIVDPADTAFVLIDIAISRAFRQKGIASKLIRSLQSDAAAACVPLTLHVDRTNHNAFSLYQKLGFEVSGENEIHFSMTWTGPSQ